MPFQIGNTIRLAVDQTQVGIIIDRETINGHEHYRVHFSPEDRNTYYPENELILDAEEEHFNFINRVKFLKFLIVKKIQRPLIDNLYTFYSSRTEFQVHQFKPVLKFLSSPNQRLFIADEVGLGKTIEAGIILTELSARTQVLDHVIVVCPAALCTKWQSEMEHRFGEFFEILNGQDFLDLLRRNARGDRIHNLKSIISLQSIRRDGIQEHLGNSNIHFDLVIVDESHHMRNSNTQSYRIGKLLSEKSDAFLMMSATPLQLRTGDLFNQLHILDPDQFPDLDYFEQFIRPNQYLNSALRNLHQPQIALRQLRKVEQTEEAHRFNRNPNYRHCLHALNDWDNLDALQQVQVQKQLTELNTLSYIFTRTRRRDVVDDVFQFPIRQANVLEVQFSEQEQDFYDAITNWVINRYADNQQGLSFAKIMPQRQVASCIPAMREYLRQTIRDRQLEAIREEDGDDFGIDLGVNVNLELNRAEINELYRLLRMAERLGEQDTKFRVFLNALRELQQTNSKIVVFSFFKHTLRYLEEQLTEQGFPNTIIHGDVPRLEREQRIREFWEEPDLNVLLSSEVGAEGLDLQVANVLFNYDLPWNPMKVEQRIGRLDRYGQQNNIISIYNFSINGTIDGIILNRLYRRIGIFEQYIGDLEQILGERIYEFVPDLFNPELTEAEINERIDQVVDNLRARQTDLEELEQQAENFIGQDDFFTRQITRIRDTRRFVTADEIRFLIDNFFQNWQGCEVYQRRIDRQNIYTLRYSRELVAFIERYAPCDDKTRELVANLRRNRRNLRRNRRTIQVTFDSTEACRDSSLIFITIHSPLIKAIVEYTCRDREFQRIQRPLGRLQIRTYNNLIGLYFLSIYLLSKRSIQTSLKLVPILVNTENFDQIYYDQDEEADLIIGKLFSSINLDDNFQISDEIFKQAMDKSSKTFESIRNDTQNTLQQQNDILLDNRIATITQALHIKINQIRNTIAILDPNQTRMIALHEGRIRNLQTRAAERIAELEKNRQTTVGYECIAYSLVNFY